MSDPIVGKYLLQSSEGFDEVLIALGVGMMKRKMATSVSPANVVEIADDGTYTIRTETTLRTTEIKFKLGEPFTETTIDGRTTTTTPSRAGNVLTLEQKGNSSKKEKDSVMIREFEENGKMTLTIKVDNVVCKRHYQKS